MALYISRGVISDMSEVQTGTSLKGNTWRRMTLTLEVAISQNAVSKQIFQVFGDAVDDVLRYKRGDQVEVTFTLYAKEWNGKLYNNVDLWKITGGAPAAQQEKPQHQSQGATQESDDPKDDLPF